MNETDNRIPFRLVGISTEEFATFKEHLVPEEQAFQIGLNVRVKANQEDHLVGIFTRFIFEQEGNAVLVLEAACHFQLEKIFWDASTDNNLLVLPKGFTTHLLTLSVGTARGIVHAKKPDWLPNLLLPTIDVSAIFKEDIHLDLQQSDLGEA